MKNFWLKVKSWIEAVIPMTLGSLVLFLFIAYLLFSLGRSIWTNYQANKSIIEEQKKVQALKQDVDFLEDQIAYYNTNSFREKQARAKLGYKAPGENVLSLANSNEESVSDQQVQEINVFKTPNPQLWWQYFFGS